MIANSESDRWRIAGPALTAVVVLIAGWVRATNFVGICRLDMFRYLELSNHVLSGGGLFDEGVFYAASRLPLMGPLIASNALWGWGEWASVAWPFACSLGTVLVVILLGRELWDWETGLVAGLVTAFFPLHVELATQLLPDPIQGFFTVLAIYCAVRAVKKDERWVRWAIGAGFALGLAYLSRVNAIIFLPGVLAVGAIVDRKRWTRSLWALLGLAAALGMAAGIFYILTGDPFIDWRRTAEFYANYQQSGFWEREESFFQLMRTTPSLTWLLPLLVAGTVYAAFDRKGRSILMLVWAYGFWFYLDVVSGWHGLDNSYRYIEPMVAPVILLASAGIAHVARLRPRWLYGSAVTIVLAISLFSMNAVLPSLVGSFRANPRWTAVRSVADTLEPLQPATVWVTSPYDLLALNYYSGFAFERNTIEPPGSSLNPEPRLFLTEELPFPGSGGVYLVTTEQTAEVVYDEIAAFPQQGEKLKIWLAP